mgnify:CR=1 FL=1
MNTSSYFVEEVKNSNMTPIEILNWYRNFYHTEDNSTEQGIMARAINDIFIRLKDIGVLDDERLKICNKDYKSKSATINKTNLFTNKKLIKLIDFIQTALINPNTDVTYDLELLKNELQEENYCIESGEE